MQGQMHETLYEVYGDVSCQAPVKVVRLLTRLIN